MDDIKVSVFCLVYNHEQYVRDALSSFVMQKTNFKYEVLVHDDASTDGSAKIISEFAERYPDIIKPIYQEKNQYSQGICIRQKVLLPLAAGEYIALCEGDDFWTDEYKLQKQYDALQNHPDCSLSTTLVQCCNEDGTYNERIIPEKRYKVNQRGVIKENEMADLLWVRGGYPFHTCSYFYRKCVEEIVDTNAWTDLPRDIDVLKACFLYGNTYYFNEAMSIRRLESKNNWNQRLKKSGVNGRIKLAREDNNNDEKFNIFTHGKYKEKIQASIFWRIMCIIVYNPKLAKEDLKKYNISYWKVRACFDMKDQFKLLLKYFLLYISPQLLEITLNYKRKAE